MKQITLVLALALLPFTLVLADESPKAQISIDDLGWMAGRWVGNAFDGVCEEVWSPPMGPTMTGSFKLVMGDKVGFYELMVISVDNGEPTLKLKHFNADLSGWEEKDSCITFEFSRLDDNYLEFDGISYQKTHADSLVITVGTKDPTGKSHLTVINCHRE